MENKTAIGHVAPDEGELGEDRRFHFDFHGEVEVRQEAVGPPEDGEEFGSLEAMIGVIRDPNLEETGTDDMSFAPAVDESFGEVADFGDVEVRRHQGTIRLREAQAMLGMGLKNIEELAGGHGGG
jgi:hypothetical protein